MRHPSDKKRRRTLAQTEGSESRSLRGMFEGPRTLGMAIEASSVPVNFENSRKSRIIEWHYAKRNAPLSGLLLFVGGTLLRTF